MGPRAFLKKNGFVFEKRPLPIERALHKSLDDYGKEKLENMWEMAKIGLHEPQSTMYLPQTPIQAAKLFSHDANRSVASMTWISKTLFSLQPGTILELGCGAGFLLGYLKSVHSEFHYTGLEILDNLSKIASEVSGVEILNQDYAAASINQKFDYLICDFGWNSGDIKDGPVPHDIQEFEGLEYCAGCSSAAEESYGKIINCWKNLLADGGSIIVTGRLPSYGYIKAFLNAANESGLSNVSKMNAWITWKSWRETERAPGFVLRESPALSNIEISNRAANFYRSNLK